ncbi:hypothetical protein Fmac_005058 [Flemingia macrophylla]|uniref:Protein kinase domain-containing protein n=1 Tax=Flemingia macrophylla TaxID=520843 RepID=A0ABD1N816_9FABA
MAVHRNLLRQCGFCMTSAQRVRKVKHSQGGDLQFQIQVAMINKAVHPNFLLLRGFCMTRTQRFLVYPFMVNGSVATSLRAVVGGFGFAKLMNYKDTHDTISLCATVGHMPPEYLSTGQISEKTDVFGYGVMLQEIIVGQRACDLARRANEDDLMFLDWVKVLVKGNRLKELVDAALEENYDLWEAEEIIQVA